MIALKTFKYLIWDYCLTKLFDGFNKNLKVNPHNYSYGSRVKIEDVYIGMRLSKIITRGNIVTGNEEFNNCKIIDICEYFIPTTFRVIFSCIHERSKVSYTICSYHDSLNPHHMSMEFII